MKFILITLVTAAAVFVIVGLRRALRTYLKFRGKRLVSCPETHQPAAVRVAAWEGGPKSNSWERPAEVERVLALA